MSKKLIKIFDETKNKLNAVNNYFCIAKITDQTLRLDAGITYACHKAPQIQIDEHELEKNPFAIFNPAELKKQKTNMLQGIKNSGCSYCWVREDANIVSRRFEYGAIYMAQHGSNIIEQIIQQGANHYPTELTISFNNTCNFKCIYCNADFSSRWAHEINSYGSLTVVDSGKVSNKNVYELEQGKNPYIKAFWKVLQEMSDHFKKITITGGEPLLNKDTFKLLQLVTTTNIEVSLISNLTVKEKLINKLINYLKTYTKKQTFILKTSIECTGDKTEYVRFGMNFKLYDTNLRLVLDTVKNYNINAQIKICMTHNALSVTDIKNMFVYMQELREKYGNLIQFTNNVLTFPSCLNIRILPTLMKTNIIDFIKTNVNHAWVTDLEKQQWVELCDYMELPIDNYEKQLKNFKQSIINLDSRRKLNFVKTFPELKNFYESIP